ncbi:MAG: 2-succinyl-5-enolpyruvyl-6-hydroxy-3-cyclohexene-1-carboxylic-acid synthase [Propionibacteriaceae bacterium]|nr:2-succinyl-5-enolpyruvyl-6-hydroxy-3-cyclohexene-1-carboxylic-acid synthase [Propionibacteriaceae bacterium]
MTDSQACAAAVIAQLVAQGVREFVVCPGSRSAPLALAVLAAQCESVRAHVRVDERAAGFLALGLAKGGAGPVAVVTTSGTAVGNMLPAVMEASHSALPLLVVSADRPESLVGFGANQTTDQHGIFSTFTRWQAQIDSRADGRSWAAQAARAVGMALGMLGGLPGPVQLNVALDVPLTDGPTVTLPAAVARGFQEPRPDSSPPAPTHFGHRVVIIAGDAPPGAYQAWGDLPVPVIAEPTCGISGPNVLRCGQLLLGSQLAGEINCAVVAGRPTLSREVNALLSRADVEVAVCGDSRGWADPAWSATTFYRDLAFGPVDSAWLPRWQAADQAVSKGLDELLAAERRLTGWHVAQLVSAAATPDDVLVVGNSSPVRDLALTEVSATVYANRGLAGIDGTVSTAIGIALARPSARAVTAYCGDLAFLHDANALAIPPQEARPPLRIVVADDHGGSIFATLEYGRGEYADVFERVFAVGIDADLVALAQAFRVPARRVATAAELNEALRTAPTEMEVIVVETDRTARAELAARIRSLATAI